MDTLKFASNLALETGELLLSYYQSTGSQSRLKSDQTLVTDADIAADQLLRKRISHAYPDDGILSEESGTKFKTKTSAVWVIDPLDGTTNFSLGLHYWGVSISRLVDGNPDIGVIYFPLLNEHFEAVKGGGSYLNGIKLNVKKTINTQKNSFFSCCSRAYRHYDIDIKFKTRILGSAAYGLATVARGSALISFEVTPKVWDFSASWLINQEARCQISSYEGLDPFPLIPGTDYQTRSFPILAAATPELQALGKAKIQKRE